MPMRCRLSPPRKPSKLAQPRSQGLRCGLIYGYDSENGKFRSNINDEKRKACPSRGHEIGSQPPIDRPNDLSRAPNAAPGNPPLGQDPPGVFFICTKGGRGGAEPDPHTNHSRNFRLEDPPQFFGQIFWEKILEIKSVLLASPRRGCYASSRSDSAAIGVVLHRWSLSSSRPTPQRLLPRPPASLKYILH